MFWETLWALILGFTLSGCVQAFVSKEHMQARLGDHRARSVLRATWYGTVSSSCSYAASAMSKSLFARGADFTTAMIFMISSTNLVVELGVVMLVLLGWQFAAAEFVGGPVMIALLALVGTAAFSGPLLVAARSRLASPADTRADGDSPSETPERSPRTREGWSNASAYAVADATMLRRELLIGYLVAGFLAVMVPSTWWGAVFWRGHGAWTVVENALVGPLIAVVSWVCSIGNVPLAAALWHGGISFGGVIAFIFADLIAMPLILIYLKFYGRALTARLVVVFYLVMVIAGLVCDVVFRALGLVPTSHTLRLTTNHWSWNYTTWLDFLFLLVSLGVVSLARQRARNGESSGYAIDPVCKMQVRIADAPARATIDGQNFYFCADRCRERFVNARADVAVATAPEPVRLDLRVKSTHANQEEVLHEEVAVVNALEDAVDPICGMRVSPATASAHRRFQGQDFYFCCDGCAKQFDE